MAYLNVLFVNVFGGGAVNAKRNQNGKSSGKYLKFRLFECSYSSRYVNLLVLPETSGYKFFPGPVESIILRRILFFLTVHFNIIV